MDASLPLIGAELALALLIAGGLAAWLRATAPRPRLPPPPRERLLPQVAPDLLPVPLAERPATDAPAAAPTPTAPETPPAAPAPSGLFALLRGALGRTQDVLRQGFDRIFGRTVDSAALDELEEALLRADVGVPTTERLLESVRRAAREHEGNPDRVKDALRAEMRAILDGVHRPLEPRSELWVVLVVGVNGSGKTTTIGKLAARFKGQGRKVLLAAGDTFRAAAEQQLGVWAERAGVDLVALEENADPAAVAFKALERARAEGHDVVLIDTAGRLQTRKPLMEQLAKIRRVIDKAAPGAPHETLLVLDGTMGQNGMSQARLFHEATPLTGVVVTKLDGTAKGGMILAIATELSLPVKLVGLGEKVGDLRDFEPGAFVDALV